MPVFINLWTTQPQFYLHVDKNTKTQMEWMETSYYEIHKIDRQHPITIVESYSRNYGLSSKLCDILIIDPYPMAHADYLTHVGNVSEVAVSAVKDNKPILNLIQTIPLNNVSPKLGEVRHMYYQAYLTGQTYVGYYCWEQDLKLGTMLDDTHMWPEMVSFNENEADLLHDYFAVGKGTYFNSYKDNEVMYESWLDEAKETLYVALINRNKNAKTVAIPLTNAAGNVTIGGTAAILAGNDSAIGGNADLAPQVEYGSMTLNLTGSDCVLLKITSLVYNTEDGFITGGGWINSPEGAYVIDTSLAGKATFGFVSKYKKGATVPTGNIEFIFAAGDLEFNSTSYDWLVIAGSKAQLKGKGTINGQGEYGFMLTAIDGGLDSTDKQDRFRIKIWDIAKDEIVYDNQLVTGDPSGLTSESTNIGGGSIVIHK